MNSDTLSELSIKKQENTLDFFRGLKHTTGKFNDMPFEPFDWQEKILRDVFGTLKEDGTRQYKTVYVEIPKKQGKSEFLAAIGLKMLCADGEWAAEVYGCAADIGQASIIFNVAKNMVQKNPDLKRSCRIVDSKKRIVYLPTKSFYQVVSAEAYTKHGLNVSAVLFDELHAQPNRELYNVMTFGSGDAREQPIFWFITTSGDDPVRGSICWEVHKKAEDILLNKRIDPTFYPVIFGIDMDEKRVWKGWTYEVFDEIDWEDQEIWRMVNPSIDKTTKMSTFVESYNSIKGNAADERLFKQLRLNIWIKTRSTKWVPYDIWMNNTGIIEREDLKDLICFGGLDLSSKMDLSAYVLVFPPQGGYPKYRILPTFWIPEDNVDDFVKKYGLPYRKWIDMGFLKTTPGNKIDYHYIVDEVVNTAKEFQIQEIGYDPFLADMIETDLTEEGLTMVEIRQTFKHMSPPMKELEAFLHGNHINHGNNPVMNWMFGNLEVITNVNADVRPTKGIRRGSSKAVTGTSYYKIDGIVGMINAFARVIVQPKDSGNIYDKRGMRSLM